MLKLNFTVILTLLCAVGFAQSAKISGKISDADNALELVTIKLEGNNGVFGSTSKENGAYEITDIPAGLYSMRISSIGYKIIEVSITIQEGETLVRDFELDEDRLNLNQVVVSATRYNQDRREAPVIVKVLNTEIFDAT